MGIFASKTAIRDLSLRLGEVETEMRRLKTANKHIELEWEELYDKVRHQMSRMSRRAKADVPENAPTSGPESADGAGDRMDTISAKILARRASNGPQP